MRRRESIKGAVLIEIGHQRVSVSHRSSLPVHIHDKEDSIFVRSRDITIAVVRSIEQPKTKLPQTRHFFKRRHVDGKKQLGKTTFEARHQFPQRLALPHPKHPRRIIQLFNNDILVSKKCVNVRHRESAVRTRRRGIVHALDTTWTFHNWVY